MSSKKSIQRIINKDMKEIYRMNLNENGIFVNFDEDNVMKAKAMIIGPSETPFENGVLFFDISFPVNYPYSPPIMKYYSRSPYRVHPNLYVGKSHDNFLGKVCLSMLNTWSGPKWTSIMHIGSILLTLQSILTKYPIENEPGFENTSIDKKELFNKIVIYDTFRNLIYENMISIPNDYKIFQDQIKTHFQEKEDVIRTKLQDLYKTCTSKIRINSGIYSYTITIDYNNLKTKFDNNFKL
jgi:ubiquitin-protein ligase